MNIYNIYNFSYVSIFNLFLIIKQPWNEKDFLMISFIITLSIKIRILLFIIN